MPVILRRSQHGAVSFPLLSSRTEGARRCEVSTQLSLRQEQCTRRTYERPRDSPHPCNIRICWLPAKCRKFAVVVGHLDVHLLLLLLVLDADGHRALEVTKHDGGAVLVLGLAGHVNCGGGSACARGREKMGERAADDVTTRNDSQGCHDGGLDYSRYSLSPLQQQRSRTHTFIL